ncbi:MAG: hypothetical protein Q8S73_26630 [Deltaproteobacteria bacterium]|nr:hypothetical protein [Myxococcales bacterium]MDP3217712.1 hypothetical protein [Deltaproteobacteria bacterium]
MSDEKSKELLRTGTSVALGAAVHGAAGHPEHAAAHAAIELGTFVISQVIGPRINSSMGRVMQRLRGWMGVETADAAAHTPDGMDTLSVIFRSLLEVPDEAALPILAALAREHLANGRKADRFLRSAARMISDCTAEDIDALRVIIKEAAAVSRGKHAIALGFRASGHDEHAVSVSSVDSAAKAWPTVRHAGRIPHLLVTSGLAQEKDVWDSVAMVLDLETLNRLVATLGEPDPMVTR